VTQNLVDVGAERNESNDAHLAVTAARKGEFGASTP